MRTVIILLLLVTSVSAQEYINYDDSSALNEELRRIRYQAEHGNEIGSSDAFYLGDKNTNGSWRIIRDGNNLVSQRRESNVWVTKDTITP